MHGRRRSASTRQVETPASASESARFAAVLVLPSPGTELVTTMIRGGSSTCENCRLARSLRKASARLECPSALTSGCRGAFLSNGMVPRPGSAVNSPSASLVLSVVSRVSRSTATPAPSSRPPSTPAARFNSGRGETGPTGATASWVTPRETGEADATPSPVRPVPDRSESGAPGTFTARTREEADKQLEEVIARIAAKQAIQPLDDRAEPMRHGVGDARRTLGRRVLNGDVDEHGVDRSLRGDSGRQFLWRDAQPQLLHHGPGHLTGGHDRGVRLHARLREGLPLVQLGGVITGGSGDEELGSGLVDGGAQFRRGERRPDPENQTDHYSRPASGKSLQESVEIQVAPLIEPREPSEMRCSVPYALPKIGTHAVHSGEPPHVASPYDPGDAHRPAIPSAAWAIGERALHHPVPSGRHHASGVDVSHMFHIYRS